MHRAPLSLERVTGCALALLVAASSPATGAWEVRGPLHPGFRVAAAASANGRLLVFDAESGRGMELVPGPTAADDAWVPLSPMPPGVTRPGFSYSDALVVGDCEVHLPGGNLGGGSSMDVHTVYDACTDTWSQLPPLPRRVQSYASAVVGESIYIAGGCCPTLSEILTWTRATGWLVEPIALSPPRNDAAGTALDGQFFVIGGHVYPGAPTCYDIVESIEPTDPPTFHSHPPLYSDRTSAAAVAACGRIYVFGGADCDGGIEEEVEVYDPATGWSFDMPLPTPHYGSAAAAWHQGRIWVFPYAEPGLVAVLDPGCALDLGECARTARNHGEYVSCVARLTQDMVQDGTLTREERQEILREAAQSDIGKR